MNRLPDDLRLRLESLRICRANGITPRVLVPAAVLPWIENVDARGGAIDDADDIRERLVAFARRQLGVDYHTHATIQSAPNAFSCSTLVKYVFASAGIWMPRYSVDQSYRGALVDSVGWKKGALAFWMGEFPIRDSDRAVGHVGIVSGDRRIIHASGSSKDVHEFTPSRPEIARFVDPVPTEPHVLVLPPNEERGLETALDIVRWLQR